MTDQVNQQGTGEGGEGEEEEHREWGEGYRRRAQGARRLEGTIDGAREGYRRRAQGARRLEDMAKSVKKQKGKLG
jgi:hypothetical protein